MLDAAGGLGVDRGAGSVAAGEGDLGHLWVLDKGGAYLGAVAGDGVDDAVGKAGLLHQLHQCQR